MESTPVPTDSIKDRTVVLTLPKGLKATYDDFFPVIDPYMGRIIAFGTVGVGYVWHITFKAISDVDSFVQAGNFSLGDYTVVVNRFKDICTVGTLHWLPYWIPHDDVVSCISRILGSKISCQYIQIPQRGYRDCFTTQRRLVSPISLDNLPHFIDIPFEGQSFRSFLFVPGRQPVCFACGGAGHMRSTCKVEKNTDKNIPFKTVPTSVTTEEVDTTDCINEMDRSTTPQPPSQPDPVVHVAKTNNLLPEPTSEGRRELTKSESEQLAVMIRICNEGKRDEQKIRSRTSSRPIVSAPNTSDSDSCCEKSIFNYLITYETAKGELKCMSRRGSDISVNPPRYNLIDDDELERCLSKCLDRRCGIFRVWEDEIIGLDYMASHLRQVHPSFNLVKDRDWN